jgi:hypothetical protein
VEPGFGDDDLFLDAAVAEESPPRLARLTIARIPQLPEPEPSPSPPPAPTPPAVHTTLPPLAASHAAEETAVHSSRIPAGFSLRGRQRVSSPIPTAATATASPALTAVTATSNVSPATTSNSSPATTSVLRNANLATLRQRKITATSSVGPSGERQTAVAPTVSTRGLGRDGPAALSERPFLTASSSAVVPTTAADEATVTGAAATGWTTDSVVSSPTAETMSPTFVAESAGDTTVPNFTLDGVETTRRGPETVLHPELG